MHVAVRKTCLCPLCRRKMKNKTALKRHLLNQRCTIMQTGIVRTLTRSYVFYPYFKVRSSVFGFRTAKHVVRVWQVHDHVRVWGSTRQVYGILSTCSQNFGTSATRTPGHDAPAFAWSPRQAQLCLSVVSGQVCHRAPPAATRKRTRSAVSQVVRADALLDRRRWAQPRRCVHNCQYLTERFCRVYSFL